MSRHECAARQMKRADYRFSRRSLRETTRWGDTQLKIHLARLVELEYLLVHRGGRGQSFEYELVFDGAAQSEAPHLSGLIDVTTIARTMARSRGSDTHLAPVTRGSSGPNAAGSRPAEMLAKPIDTAVPEEAAAKEVKTHRLRPDGHNASYVQDAAAQRP